jgi:hypothetical protein
MKRSGRRKTTRAGFLSFLVGRRMRRWQREENGDEDEDEDEEEEEEEEDEEEDERVETEGECVRRRERMCIMRAP